MITYLKLTNFRKHTSAEFEFVDGLNVVCGPNWAGKTALLSAISYAAFGSATVIGNNADLITHGETVMSVELSFTLDGQDYTVIRGTKGAELSRAGETIATGQTPVTQEMEALAGLTAKDFLDFHISREEEASALLTAGSAKFSDYVARVTGADVLNRVLDKLKDEGIKVSGALENLPDEADQLEALDREIPELTGFVSRTQAAVDLAVRLSKSAEETYRASTEELAEKNNERNKYERSKRGRSVAEGILANAKERLLEADQKLGGDPSWNLQEAKAEFGRLVDQKDAYFLLRDQKKALEKDIEDSVKNVKLCEEALEPLEKPDLTGWSQKLVDRDIELRSAEQAAEQAGKAAKDSICPYCMREFEGVNKEELLKKSKAAEDFFNELHNSVAREQEAYLELCDASGAYEKAETLLKQWQEYLEAKKAELKKVLEQKVRPIPAGDMSTAKAYVEKLTGQAEAYRTASGDRDRWKREVEKAEEALKAIEPVDKPVTTGDIQRLDLAMQGAHEMMTKAAMRANKAESEVLEGQSQLQHKLQMKNALLPRVEQHKKLVKRSTQIRDLQRFLRENRDRFTQSFWQSLLDASSRFVSQATSGGISSVLIGDNGFQYVEGGRTLPVNGNASGMQRAVIATALKLTLAAALGSRLNVMLFDEVTAAAEDANSLLITGLLAACGQQVILVTHRPTDPAAASAVTALSGR